MPGYRTNDGPVKSGTEYNRAGSSASYSIKQQEPTFRGEKAHEEDEDFEILSAPPRHNFDTAETKHLPVQQ